MWRLHPSRSPIAAALLLSLAMPAAAQDAGKLAHGKAILQEKCGRCHAVEMMGDSPLKAAPPMRDIYSRYAPRELYQELLEGKVSKHKEMPQVQFSAEEADAIMWHLYDLARRSR